VDNSALGIVAAGCSLPTFDNLRASLILAPLGQGSDAVRVHDTVRDDWSLLPLGEIHDRSKALEASAGCCCAVTESSSARFQPQPSISQMAPKLFDNLRRLEDRVKSAAAAS